MEIKKQQKVTIKRMNKDKRTIEYIAKRKNVDTLLKSPLA